MKILFLTRTLPFPARHGVELPLEMLARDFAKRGVVDFLVWCENEVAFRDFNDRFENIPKCIRKAIPLRASRNKKRFSFTKEVLGVQPSFIFDGAFDTRSIKAVLKEEYDFIWVSPLGGVGVVNQLANLGYPLKGKVVVGLNDATYGAYMNGFRYLFKRPNIKEWRRILNAFRTPWVFWYERRYMKDVAAIHVQTLLEEKRVLRLFKFCSSVPKIITKQNGRRRIKEFDCIEKHSRPIVLFMTHLARGRSFESYWFLSKVWPRVLARVKNAHLWLVGSPPNDVDRFYHSAPENVEVLGFVEDLDSCLQKADVGIIPTLHNSGWVNRVADYLQAGVPIVACKEPLETIDGLCPGKHALVSNNPEEFANQIVELLNNRDFASQIAKAGKELSDSFPSWSQMASYIYNELENLRRQ